MSTASNHHDPFAATFGTWRGSHETDSLVSRVITDKSVAAFDDVQKMNHKERWDYVISRIGQYSDFRERPMLLELFREVQEKVIKHYHGNEGRYMRLVLQAMEIRSKSSNRVVADGETLHIWPRGDTMPLDKKNALTVVTACGHKMNIVQSDRVLIGRWAMPGYTDQWDFPKAHHRCKGCEGADTIDERNEAMRRPKLSFSQDGVFTQNLVAQSDIVIDDIITSRSWREYNETDFSAAVIANVWPAYVSELANDVQARIVKDIFDAKLYAKYHKRGADGFYEDDTWDKVVQAAKTKAYEIAPSSNHFSARDVQAVKRVVRHQLCEQLHMNEPAF